MRLISSLFITCIGNFPINLVSMLVLYLLYFDLKMGDAILIGTGLNLLLIGIICLVVYFPLYLFNRNFFLENETFVVYQRYLFITLLPLLLFAAFASEIIIRDTKIKIILTNLLISVLFSFYLFTKTIKNYDQSTK
jgi:hypothetical protein